MNIKNFIIYAVLGRVLTLETGEISPVLGESDIEALNIVFDDTVNDARLEDNDDFEVLEAGPKKQGRIPAFTDVWKVKKSDFPTIWTQYKNSGHSLDVFLNKTFDIHVAPISKDQLKKIIRLKGKSWNEDEYEQSLMRKSIKRHVALNYGTYLLEGGNQIRNFKVPFCQHIGLETEKSRDGEMMGRGFQGDVRIASFEGSSSSFAIKTFRNKKFFTQEIKYLGKVMHKNVIQPVCFRFLESSSDTHYDIVMPAYTPHNEMESFQSLNFAKKMFKGLCRGFYAMHQKGILHLDMKTDNYVIYKNEPVIIDFGFTQSFQEAKLLDKRAIACIPYMAPEQYWSPLSKDREFRRGVTTSKTVDYGIGAYTDWWKLGLSFGLDASKIYNVERADFNITDNKDDLNFGPIKFEIPKMFGKEFTDFLNLFFASNPADRNWSSSPQKLEELLSSPFLKESRSFLWLWIILALIVLILIAALIAFFYYKKKTQNDPEQTQK